MASSLDSLEEMGVLWGVLCLLENQLSVPAQVRSPTRKPQPTRACWAWLQGNLSLPHSARDLQHGPQWASLGSQSESPAGLVLQWRLRAFDNLVHHSALSSPAHPLSPVHAHQGSEPDPAAGKLRCI